MSSRVRVHHVDHELDDVARRAELAVLASGGNAREHVLVDVALGVAVVHLDGVETLDRPPEQRRGRDREAGVFHILHVRIARSEVASLGRFPQKGEDRLADNRVHLLVAQVLESRPAIVHVGAAGIVGALGEDAALHRATGAVRLAFFERVEIVKALDEEQIRELLHHFKRVGDPSRPEVVPDLVDLVACFSGKHVVAFSSEGLRLQPVQVGLRAEVSGIL